MITVRDTTCRGRACMSIKTDSATSWCNGQLDISGEEQPPFPPDCGKGEEEIRTVVLRFG